MGDFVGLIVKAAQWYFDLVVKFVNEIQYELEITFVAPVAEFWMVIWYHLNPRVYSSAARLRGVTEGKVPHKGDTYALLVLFARHRIPAFTRTLIDAIGRSDINLVIVSNTELTPAFRDELLGLSHLVIERANLGRDFGGYKDGIEIMRARFPALQRLILMNDSVYYFERGLDEMLRQLCQDNDLIGVNETFENHYHIQSFILSFSRRVMELKRFRKFWKRYRPISTRRWAVHYGEVGFTRAMMRSGVRPHILYHGAALGTHLRPRPPREILDALRYMPVFFRNLLYREFDAVLKDQVSTSKENFSMLGRGMRYFDKSDDDGTQSRRMNEMASALTESVGTSFEYQRWKLERFVGRIVQIITTRNQCHVGGFLFAKYLGAPIAKRDLFYREVYDLPDIYDILTDLREPLRDEVLSDLRQKGPSIYMGTLARILYRHGVI